MDKKLSKNSVYKNFFAKIKSLPRKQLIAGIIVILLIVLVPVLYFNSNSYKYGQAEELLKEGNFTEAIAAFTELGDYKDSEFKVTECNRRILFDYLQKNGGYELCNDNYTYQLTPIEDKISLTVILPQKVEFSLFFAMDSDDGEFCCEFTPQENISATSKGDCKISALTTENDLEIDHNSGDYTAVQMKTLVDSTCDLLCMNLGAILDKFELDLTPADIGFTGIE